MASEALKEALASYDAYVKQNGINEQAINAYMAALDTCFSKEKDIDFGMSYTPKVKSFIEKFVEQMTGGNIRQLEQASFNSKQKFKILEQYYKVLKYESWSNFESFMFYMEKLRDPSKRFYQPRRKTLHVVAEDLMALERGDYIFYGLSMPSRVGKALAYDTPVLTKNGWKNHGELTILDEVIGADGKFHKIQAIHNPCQMEYKVTFSDGDSVVCHGNHEWVVVPRGTNDTRTLETKRMFGNTGCPDGHKRYALLKKEIFEGTHKNLYVSPYALGAWLGDGRNKNPDICGAETDYPIVQKILNDGYELAWDTKHKTTGVRYYGFRGLRDGLQKYGMCHSRRRVEKHIPSDYLVADVDQRLELLAGLLDTDGSLAKKEKRYHFTTNEVALRDDFITLVNSFGWRTNVMRYESGMSSSGINANKPYWVVSFNPTMHIPCQLERKQLHEFSKQRCVTIENIEKIEEPIYGNCITVDGGIYLVGKTLKPTHNSTICIFFLAWISMKYPNSHSAMGGHSGILAKGFQKELLNLMMTEEYTFGDLYSYWHPGHVMLREKSAEDLTITLDEPDRFATITCRGIDGTWTGAVDISKDGYLYVDDLVRDREHSLSPTRMENTWQEYLNKMVDRKNDGAKELMVGTLWNVLDPLERLSKIYANNPKYLFRRIPALDENDESNFAYEINGFSTEYYRTMRERLDNAEWMAKYQQRPYVREGLLFPDGEIKTFRLSQIDEDTNSIIAACDPALGGGDYLSFPICQYDKNRKKRYIIGWVYSNKSTKSTVPMMVDAIYRYHITIVLIENDGAAAIVSKELKDELEKRGCNFCSIVTKHAPNKLSKEDKIKGCADYIKDNFYFLEPGTEGRNADYDDAMSWLQMYTSVGKNVHDDAPDSLTMLSLYFKPIVENDVDVPEFNPFRDKGYYGYYN